MIVKRAEPIYRQIVMHFEKGILEGRLKPGERIPSTQELAKDFGVNPETVQAGLKILTDMGLVERRRKCGTFVRKSSSKAKTVALVFGKENYGNLDMAIFVVMLSKVEELMAKEGWNVKHYATTRGRRLDSVFYELERDVSEGSVDAVLDICSSELVKEWVESSCLVPSISCPLAIDYEDFIRKGVAHLASQGRRRPVLVYDKDHMDSKTVKGALSELERLYGLEPVKVIHSEPSQRWGYDTAKRLFEDGVAFDSMLVLYDNTFRGVLYHLLERNVRIPEELALISHSNKGIDIMCHMPLTRLEFDPADFAFQAMELLKAKLEGRKPKCADVKAVLVEGLTCGEGRR